LRGSNGFGYNPVFLDEELGLTAAQMEPAQKNGRSHRAKALQLLVQQLSTQLAR
ncbi:MAG: non-canonical purine NTP pyrophosphatase, partial [Stenotrophomonas sp.]